MTVDGVPEEVLVQEAAVCPNRPSGAEATVGARPVATRPGQVTSVMPGTVVDVLVQPGQRITGGAPVAVIEAMKMEYQVTASVAGTVLAVFVQKGDNINRDEVLLEIDSLAGVDPA